MIRILDPTLGVRTVATGLSQPTSMAFVGSNSFLVLEKDAGRVRIVTSPFFAPFRNAELSR